MTEVIQESLIIKPDNQNQCEGIILVLCPRFAQISYRLLWVNKTWKMFMSTHLGVDVVNKFTILTCSMTQYVSQVVTWSMALRRIVVYFSVSISGREYMSDRHWGSLLEESPYHPLTKSCTSVAGVTSFPPITLSKSSMF